MVSSCSGDEYVIMPDKPLDHTAYIEMSPEPLSPLLQQLREQLSLTLGDAEEVIAYNMPGFQIGSTIVAGYAAFSKQCGLYVSPGSISAHADEIAVSGLKASKTGVTFSPGKPLSDELICKLAQSSRDDHGL